MYSVIRVDPDGYHGYISVWKNISDAMTEFDSYRSYHPNVHFQVIDGNGVVCFDSKASV